MLFRMKQLFWCGTAVFVCTYSGRRAAWHDGLMMRFGHST
jgi:hypothetical protein